MFASEPAGKILIRNIPKFIWDKFTELARIHDRSLEGEARQAIRAWVEPALREADRQGRRVEVSARLRSALDNVNLLLGNRGRSKISHLAQAIGEEHAEHVEHWFSGEREPSFGQLEKIATYFGIEPGWLQHGDRHQFILQSDRIPEGPEEGRKWLLNGRFGEPAALYFVRADNARGDLVVVRRYDDWRCDVIHPPYIVSTNTGAGGFASLVALFELWRDLYKFYTTHGDIDVKSYLMSENGFQDLCGGDVHPLLSLQAARQAAWWEDCWDGDQYRKREYWPDWLTMCESVNSEIRKRAAIATPSDVFFS